MSTSSRLAVLVFTDLVGSTELKVRLGAAFTPLLERHNALFEKACAEFHGEVLKHTGDGYFAAFPTASDAVRAALSFQSAMRLEPWPHPMLSRVGIHVGEVALLKMAGRADVSGVAADLTAKVMGLAAGGQILLTRSVFNDARQFVAEHPAIDGAAAPTLRWIAHGSYLFDGIEEPQEVFEVGAVGGAPLIAPLGGEKARRVVPHDQEQTLGWRPAVGLTIEGRPGWVLERKLGEGGFGEVWLGQHERTKQQRVFKFCFDVERLRSFKREMTLFRLLREALGDRSDIAKLYEVKLDVLPFFLESEYTNGGDLAEWAEKQGGLRNVPLEQRLEIVAQIADAVAAAHSVGVLHKDIKPSNVLIQVEPNGRVQPRLSDFGIGFLADKSQLAARHITETGFTIVTMNDSSRTGTRMYSPPEVMAGKPFTTQGDVFALGVMLYQAIVADPNKPLAEGWERDVADELLVADITACVEGDPSRRLGHAAELAQRVRSLPNRRAAVCEQALKSQREQWHRRTIRKTVFLLLGVMLMTIAGGATAFVYISKLREANRLVIAQSYEAERQKSAAQVEATKSAAVADFVGSMLRGANPRYAKGQAMTVREVLDSAGESLNAGSLAKQPAVEAEVRSILAQSYTALGIYGPAERHVAKVVEIARTLYPPDDWHLAAAWTELGMVFDYEGQLAGAESAYMTALQIWRRPRQTQMSEYIRTLACLAGVLNQQHRPVGAIQDEALQVLQRVERSDSEKSAPALYRVGFMFWESNDFARAESLYKESLEICKRARLEHFIVTPMNALARVLEAEGKNAEAESLFRECITLLNSYRPPPVGTLGVVYSNLATLLEERGDLAGAEVAYKNDISYCREGQPLSARVAGQLKQLANLLRSQGRVDEADNLLREEGDRGNIFAQNARAWQLARDPKADSQRIQLAVEVAAKAVASAPTNGDFWNTLGAARYRNGQWGDSIAALEKSIELGSGGDAFNLFFLSMAHWKLAEREAAQTYYAKGVAWTDKNAPQNEELRALRSEAAALEGVADANHHPAHPSSAATTRSAQSSPAQPATSAPAIN